MAAVRRVARWASAAGIVSLLGLAGSGCSDSDYGAPDSAAGTVDAFCAGFQALEDEFSDPNSDATGADIAEAINELDPPDDIADDVAAFADGAAAADEVDQNDPAAAEFFAELQAAVTRVNEYRADECDAPEGAGS